MSDSQTGKTRAGKILGTVVLSVVYAPLFLLFWFSRAVADEADTGWTEPGKTLKDLIWSHLGGTALFALIGGLAIGLLWARPGRRLGIALAGVLSSILATLAFRMILGQFHPSQGFGSVLFYPVVVLLMLASGVSAVVFISLTIAERRSRRRTSQTPATGPGNTPPS